MSMLKKNKYAVKLGSIKTEKKAKSSRENGKLGGRPTNANPLFGTRQYRAWSSMKERCNNPNTKCFSRYGGRGIKVCDSWNSFHNFWKDMKEGYEDTLKLDRINNEKGYSKKNCRWVTHKENCNNKGNHRYITLDGVTKNITQWAEMLGEKPQTLNKRIKRGWSIKDALLLPNLRFKK